MLSLDLGIEFVRLVSNYYYKYNYNYHEYNKDFGSGMNLGREWWSPYASVLIQRVISNRSKIAYSSSPFANTFSYVGVQLKFNTPGKDEAGQTDPSFRFRETYQTNIIVGRQVALGKNGILLFDFYSGLGVMSNYNLDIFSPKIIIGLRTGINLFSVNE